MTNWSMEIHAFIVMPDHVHLLLTPAPDVSLEKAMQYIKGGFSFRLKSKMDVWERSFNEVQIVSAEKFAACKHYIEQNPVRERMVLVAAEFAYSSAFPVGTPAFRSCCCRCLSFRVARPQTPITSFRV